MQVADINPLALPSLPLKMRSQLPSLPGIYFVLNGTEVVYIGKSWSIKSRWDGHHRLPQLREIGKQYSIAWLQYQFEQLDALEFQLIQALRPRLNGSLVVPATAPRPKKSEPFKYGDKKERFQFLLTPEASTMLDRVAEQMQLTRSEVLERLIRSDCLDSAKLADKSEIEDVDD